MLSLLTYVVFNFLCSYLIYDSNIWSKRYHEILFLIMTSLFDKYDVISDMTVSNVRHRQQRRVFTKYAFLSYYFVNGNIFTEKFIQPFLLNKTQLSTGFHYVQMQVHCFFISRFRCIVCNALHLQIWSLFSFYKFHIFLIYKE